MDPEDRTSIKLLHGESHHAGPSTSGRKPPVAVPNLAVKGSPIQWKNPPTAISTPSNDRREPQQARHKTSTAQSPWNRGSMGSGNKTAKASSVATYHQQTTKRQKTSHGVEKGGRVVLARGNPKYNLNAPVPIAPGEPPSADEPIDVDESQPPTDPLNIELSHEITSIEDVDKPWAPSDKGKGREYSSAPTGRKRQKALISDDDDDEVQVLSQAPVSSTHSATPASKKKKHNGRHSLNGQVEYPDSPIEDFTSEAEQSAPKFPTPHPRKTVRASDSAPVPSGHVRAMAKVFEPINPKDSQGKGPRIDFTRFAAEEGRQRPKMTDRMKKKPPLLKPTGGPSKRASSPVREDPLSSSTFNKPSQSTHRSHYFESQPKRPPRPNSILPIDYFYLGSKRFDGGWTLTWNDEEWMVIKAAHASSTLDTYEFDFRKDIRTVVYLPVQEEPEDTRLIGMKFQTNTSSVHFPGSESYFMMGDTHAGVITVAIDMDHFDWDYDVYTSFIDWAKKLHPGTSQVIQLGSGGSKSMLNVAERKHEAWKNQVTNSAHRQASKRSRSKASTPDEAKPGQLTLEGMLSRGNSRSRPSTRSTPGDDTDVSVRRSGRVRPTPIRRPSPPRNPDEVILCYPQGVPGAINITNGDLSRLDPSEYLNDTLIEFGLKLWLRQLEEHNKELVSQIHVFSSFFYKKLNRKNVREGYESVRKWTAKVDIFNKKYIIVPINENYHWYLVIIYHPEHVLLPPPPPPPVKEPITRSRKSVATEHDPVQETSDATEAVDPQAGPTITDGADAQGTLSESKEPTELAPAATFTEPDPTIDPPMEVDHREEVEHFEITSPDPEIIQEDRSEDRSDTHYGSEISDEASVRKQLFASGCSVEIAFGSDDNRNDVVAALGPENEAVMESGTPSQTISPPPEMEVDQPSVVSPTARASSPTLSDMETNNLPAETAQPDVEMQEPATDRMNIDLEEIEDNAAVGSGPPPGVPPQRFYSSNSKKAARIRETEPSLIVLTDEDTSQPKAEREPEPEPEEEEIGPDTRTYIFTMDSLGSRHPQAIKQLTAYLQLEAEDKKGITDSSRAVGKQAFVPAQPNFCDCGLYLLHFAETFMTNPDRFAEIIKRGPKAISAQERKEVWHDQKPAGMRESLKLDIMRLSEAWKKAKLGKEEAVKETAEAQPTPAPAVAPAPAAPAVETVESSDDEVDIVETNIVSSTPASGKNRKKEKAPTPAPVRGKAARLRG